MKTAWKTGDREAFNVAYQIIKSISLHRQLITITIMRQLINQTEFQARWTLYLGSLKVRFLCFKFFCHLTSDSLFLLLFSSIFSVYFCVFSIPILAFQSFLIYMPIDLFIRFYSRLDAYHSLEYFPLILFFGNVIALPNSARL